jgi:hypothetical protein
MVLGRRRAASEGGTAANDVVGSVLRPRRDRVSGWRGAMGAGQFRGIVCECVCLMN